MIKGKVLITGGAGYIGSILAETILRATYHDIVIIDNLMYKQNSLLNLIGNRRVKFVKGDVRDEGIMKDHLKSADFIIPLAAIVGMPAVKALPRESREINFESIKIIEQNTSRDQYIIYPTTNSGYGVGQADKFCTEETPLAPVSQYGVDKAEAEKLLLDSGKATTFRLATVFGLSPRMRLDLLVNDFTYRAYTDNYIVLFESHFKRNFIHINDVADAFIHAMTGNCKKEIYNVGLDNANMSKLELCQEIKKHIPNFYIGESAINEDPDKRDYIVSSGKLMGTGWRPRVNLSDGIKSLIEGYSIVSNLNKTNLTNL